MLIGPAAFPAVLKVGHAHAGYGKMRVHDHREFGDFASVLAVGGNYCTAEPFITASCDVRVQKIGSHYRAFKRVSMSGNWKTNTGSSVIQPVAVSASFRRWIDAAAEMFGGLDICTVDAVAKHRPSRRPVPGSDKALATSDSGQTAVDELVRAIAAIDTDAMGQRGVAVADDGDGGDEDDSGGDEDEYTILEVNGTSSGFAPDTEVEDNGHIRDLVLLRMTELWG